MSNPNFNFKQFNVMQDRCGMKVCTDACIQGAWTAAMTAMDTENILDIGTGTGLLSLMIAQQIKGGIDAVELDEAAAEQAKENFLQSPWKERLHIHSMNISQFISDKKYGLVISNPPFFENDLQSPDEARNKARHEGSMNMEILLEKISQYLLPQEGIASILTPYHRSAGLIDAAAKFGLSPDFLLAIRHTNKHKHHAMVALLRKDREEQIRVASLSIKDEQNHYTEAFYTLLSPYYLHL
jgi:tRNA1Val (adenine37-N6)-methyltransferase